MLFSLVELYHHFGGTCCFCYVDRGKTMQGKAMQYTGEREDTQGLWAWKMCKESCSQYSMVIGDKLHV
jgi:hypothetical protein